MSKIKNRGLDQYGAEPFKQQQFETAGTEGVKLRKAALWLNNTHRFKVKFSAISHAAFLTILFNVKRLTFHD